MEADGNGQPAGDEALLQAYVRRGDTRAFGVLVERYAGLVYGACRSVLGPDSGAAEDAAQAVFMVLARRAGSIDSRAQVGGWLYRTAVQTARTVRRSEYRRRRREAEVAVDMSSRDRSTGPMKALEQAELSGHISEAIARLPEKQREAIVLCYLMEMEQHAAAGRVGCTAKAMQKRVQHGMAKLKKWLAAAGFGGVTPAVIVELLHQQGRATAPAGLTAKWAATAAASGGAAWTWTALGMARHVATAKATMVGAAVAVVALVATPVVWMAAGGAGTSGGAGATTATAPAASAPAETVPAGEKPPRYRLVDLGAFYDGPLPKGKLLRMRGSSSAYTINEAGQVAGHSTVQRTGEVFITTACVWDGKGKATEIGAGETDYAVATCLNNRGEAAGYVRKSPQETRAFRWDAKRGMQMLAYVSPAYPGYPGKGQALKSTASGINDAGVVVGDSTIYSADDYKHPYTVVVWDGDKPVQSLEKYLGKASTYHVSFATAINKRGDIVGQTAGDLGVPTNSYSGFVLRAKGDGTYAAAGLNPLGGKVAVWPQAVNNAGVVVGSTPYGEMGAEGDDRWEGAFAWDAETGKMKKLGKAGYTFSHAYGVNDAGWAVGALVNFANQPVRFDEVSTGALWNVASGELFKLNELVDEAKEWHVDAARGINGRGQIAATATNKDGRVHAVRLDPAGR